MLNGQCHETFDHFFAQNILSGPHMNTEQAKAVSQKYQITFFVSFFFSFYFFWSKIISRVSGYIAVDYADTMSM